LSGPCGRSCPAVCDARGRGCKPRTLRRRCAKARVRQRTRGACAPSSGARPPRWGPDRCFQRGEFPKSSRGTSVAAALSRPECSFKAPACAANRRALRQRRAEDRRDRPRGDEGRRTMRSPRCGDGVRTSLPASMPTTNVLLGHVPVLFACMNGQCRHRDRGGRR